MKTYTVTTFQFSLVEKKVKSVNKRLARHGHAERLSITEVATRIATRKDKSGRKTKYEAVDFTLTGACTVNGGWNFIAVIDHDPAGNLIMGAGEDVDAVTLQHAAPTCDHCNHNRRRKTTVIVERDGERKRVGSTCLNAYLDCPAAITIARFIRNLDQTVSDINDDFWSENWTPSGWAPLDVLSAAALASENGKKYDLDAMKKTIAMELNNRLVDQYGKHIRPTEENIAFAQDVLDWAEAEFENPTSSYAVNVKSMIDREYVTAKGFGIMASLTRGYVRAQGQKAAKENKLNAYVGNVGEREEWDLTLVHIAGWNGYYGWTHLYIFEDQEGRCFTWRTGKDIEAERGDTIRIKGTIKAHDTYKGTKQTVLTRCKVAA